MYSFSFRKLWRTGSLTDIKFGFKGNEKASFKFVLNRTRLSLDGISQRFSNNNAHSFEIALSLPYLPI